ncbi:hypothetical protein SDJN03_10587, partial [Cucurbita argyrosperma subsp. sororia]
MSCTSPFSFTLIRKTLPIYYSSSSSSNLVIPSFLSHGEFLPFKNSAPLSRFLLVGDSPEFPQKSPIPEPSVPLEIPQISTSPEIDPITPPELPPLTPGPDFPGLPSPLPPGPDLPVPPVPSPPGIDVPIPPHKPPDIEPPRPGSPVPEPDILPPPPPEFPPPRPPGPEILTSPSSPDIPPVAMF